MQDAVVQQILEQANLPQDSQNLEPIPADQTDVKAFEAAMEIQDDKVPVGTIGDAILDGMSTIKQHYDVKMGKLQDMAGVERALTFQEVMSIQIDLAKIAIRGDLVTKATTRMTQNLDTLMKSQ